MNPFTTDIAVRWSDQDINRHVNNARIVTLIEEARLAALVHWLGTEGIPDPAQPRVVVSLHLDYLRPINHGPQLTAQVTVGAVGRSSYTLDCDLLQYGQAAARARTVLVQMDAQTGRPQPLPEHLRVALDGLRARTSASGGGDGNVPDEVDGAEGTDGGASAVAADAGASRA